MLLLKDSIVNNYVTALLTCHNRPFIVRMASPVGVFCYKERHFQTALSPNRFLKEARFGTSFYVHAITPRPHLPTSFYPLFFPSLVR